MSTTMKHLTSLIAHVPVDAFEIVNGPSAAKCMEVLESLHQMIKNSSDINVEPYIELTFTLTTFASNQQFRRTLKVLSIRNVYDGEFTFTAYFSERIIEGTYNMINHKGDFGLI